MDLNLLNHINFDLEWKTVKRGRRSMTRRPRKPGAARFESGDRRQDPGSSETQKSGEDLYVRHIAEKVVDAPLKKRRLLRQSMPPPPATPCPDVEGDPSPGPQTPSALHEDPGQRFCSNSLSQNQKTKPKKGFSNSTKVKPAKKYACKLDDFSGIELLAAAAAASFIHDDDDPAKDCFGLKEHTTPVVRLGATDSKESAIPSESNWSSIQDSMVHDTHDSGNEKGEKKGDSMVYDTHYSGNEKGEKKVAPCKELRLHWDLNTVMDEWEEPRNDFLVGPQIQENHSEGVSSKSCMINVEGYSRCAEVVGAEGRSGVYVNQSLVKHDAAISIVPFNENCNNVSFGKIYGDSTCSEEMVSTKTLTSKTSDAESSATKPDVVDTRIHSVKCEDFSASTTSILREQVIMKGESDTLDDHLVQFKPKTTNSKSEWQPVLEEVVQECQSPRICENYCDNKVNSKSDWQPVLEEVVQECQSPRLCDNKVTSEGPVSECCGSNVTQDEQGQMTEGDATDKVQIGYDSPFEDGELREPIGWEENEIEEKETMCYEAHNIHTDEFGTIEVPSSGKSKLSYDHVKTTEDAVHDNNIKQGGQADGYNEGLGRDFSERKNRHGESRSHGGNLLHLVESASSDMCRNGAYAWQSRSGNLGDSYSRFGRDKIRFKDGSHNYDMRKDVSGDPVARSVGCRILDNEHPRNYNPRGVYRRPSPSERTNSYGIHRVERRSRDRYMNGSEFHPQGWRRAREEEYDDPKPRYLERKAGCFSSTFNRHGRRSLSRSRSGSPIAWHFQKRRNPDAARQSPDREPIIKAESLSRVHASPERFSKCFDDRKFVGDVKYRDTRRNDRREPIDHRHERFKSDDHFRFSRINGPGTGREHKHKINGDDMRKHDGHYEKENRVRRSDDVDGERRYRRTMNGSFGTCNFGSYSRDGGNEHSCCFKNEGMHDSKS